MLHLSVATAIGLVLPGALQAINPTPNPSNPKPGDSLVVAGMSIFIVSWIILCCLVVILYKTPGKLGLEKKVSTMLHLAPVTTTIANLTGS